MTVEQRRQQVGKRLMEAAARYGRRPGDIDLLAVSKRQSAEKIAELAALGQQQFAESYLQEALEKQAVLEHLSLTWHFIGPIQSNKTRGIAEHFSWVHSVDRVKIAHRLSEQRPDHLAPLNILLQVDISDEAGKQGVDEDQLPAMVKMVVGLPRLRFRGLMAIPAASTDFDEQRRAFARLKVLFDRCRQTGYDVDTLSMGMSGDLEAAIAEGSTMVRIGTALFGPRE